MHYVRLHRLVDLKRCIKTASMTRFASLAFTYATMGDEIDGSLGHSPPILRNCTGKPDSENERFKLQRTSTWIFIAPGTTGCKHKGGDDIAIYPGLLG